jgi:hypothetical protein
LENKNKNARQKERKTLESIFVVEQKCDPFVISILQVIVFRAVSRHTPLFVRLDSISG